MHSNAQKAKKNRSRAFYRPANNKKNLGRYCQSIHDVGGNNVNACLGRLWFLVAIAIAVVVGEAGLHDATGRTVRRDVARPPTTEVGAQARGDDKRAAPGRGGR